MAIEIVTGNSSYSAYTYPSNGMCDGVSPKEDQRSLAILALLDELQAHCYDHLCPTPETQRFALTKRQKLAGDQALCAKTLQDVWGWSLPVSRTTISNLHSQAVIDALIESGALVQDSPDSTLLHPRIRVSGLFPFGSLPNYYIHSSWPTNTGDSVFFGPESYRFTRYVASVAGKMHDCRLAIDVCSGAGVGVFQLAHSFPRATILGLDINPRAIQMAEINRRHLFPNREKAAPIKMIVSDGFLDVLEHVRGQVDVVTINPPFIAGDKRTYAAGGPSGMELILRMIDEARQALRVGGELYGHMAAPTSFNGKDRFKESLQALSDFWELVAYDVLDVDIFGDEMESPENYPDIARLASVGLVLRKIA